MLYISWYRLLWNISILYNENVEMRMRNTASYMLMMLKCTNIYLAMDGYVLHTL